MTDEAKGRAGELDGLERTMRRLAEPADFRTTRDIESAQRALYLGLCVRELCDTLVGRLGR